MKFKQVDCIVQILLILGTVFYNLINPGLLDNFLIPSYFIVGGWQVLSVFVHIALPDSHKSKLRKVYVGLLIATVVITLLAVSLMLNAYGDNIIIYMFSILFWTPALAILYLITCLLETRRLKEIQKSTGSTSETI